MLIIFNYAQLERSRLHEKLIVKEQSVQCHGWLRLFHKGQ